MRTRLTDLLKIEHPVMLAGMGGVSYGELVAAVSEAGGYGVLGAATMTAPGKLAQEIATVRSRTDKPFGVDALTAYPQEVAALLPALIEGGASMFVGALGIPRDVVGQLHDAGILVASLCGKARHAAAAVEAGCDVVIAVGTEAGGHTGAVATFALVPAVVDAVDGQVPVVAGGGVADGRGLAAALALGADGVWVGTRFVASVEARRLKGYTEAILAGREDDTVITRAYSGKTMRVLRNDWTDHYDQHPEDLLPFPEQREYAIAQRVTHLGGANDSTVDETREGYLCGQGVALIHDVRPAADIVHDMVDQAEARLRSLAAPAARG